SFPHPCGSLGMDNVRQPAAPRLLLLDRHGCYAALEQLLGCPCREQLHETGNDARPASLMAGAKAGAVVAVEVFVEQDEIAPVRVFLELPRAAVDRPPAILVLEEHVRQPARNLLG